MFQTVTLLQVASQAAYKASKLQKRQVAVIVKAPALPPTPPYRSVRADTPYGEVRITTLPLPSGDWKVIVKFPKEGFRLGELVSQKS